MINIPQTVSIRVESMRITIEYCQRWNYKPRASRLEDELKQKFGADIRVELIAGSGGVFEVTVDGNLVFSKSQLGRFPDEGEIVKLLSAAWIVIYDNCKVPSTVVKKVGMRGGKKAVRIQLFDLSRQNAVKSLASLSLSIG